MSKALEALKLVRFHESFGNNGMFEEEYQLIEKALKDYERYKPLIENIQNGLTDTISVEDLKVLIKRSKALEIIKNKQVDIHWLKGCKKIEEYNDCVNPWEKELTQEEYDLLKEALL